MLYEKGFIYPCNKTRKDIHSAEVLASSGNEYLFPENFRTEITVDRIDHFPGNTNWRFRTNWGDQVGFADIEKAEQSFLVDRFVRLLGEKMELPLMNWQLLWMITT